MKEYQFNLIVSIMNAIGLGIVVGAPTIVDPLMEPLRSQLYGCTSNYPLGLSILTVSPLIGVLTYLVNEKEILGSSNKATFTGLCAIIPSLLSLFNFSPKPHLWVLQNGSCYGLLIGLIVYCHNYEPNLPIEKLRNAKIADRARVEKVKLEHETWFRALIIIVTFSTAAAGYLIFTGFSRTMDYFTIGKEPTEEVLRIAFITDIAATIIAMYAGTFLFALIWISLKKMKEISDKLYEVPPEIKETSSKARE